MVLRLPALTDFECNGCGAQLEWKADFKDINSSKYTAKHCNEDYIITIDSVKVEAVRHYVEEDIKVEINAGSCNNQTNKGRLQRQNYQTIKSH